MAKTLALLNTHNNMKNIKINQSKSLGVFAIMAVLAVITVFTPNTAHAWYGNPPYGYGGPSYDYVSRPVQVVAQPIQVVQPVQVVQTPVYVPVAVPVYQPLAVSCMANSTYTPAGSSVTWNAYVSGGSGYYNYSWSGTDGLYGYGRSASIYYQTPGTKYASVTVYSGNQSITVACNNNVVAYPIVVQPIVQQPVVYTNPTYNNSYMTQATNGLDIGCYADPTKASINQPVTWTAEVVGGVAPYTYSWSGTNDLNGSQSSVTKWYSTSGEKYAIVSVTSADGKSATKACSSSVKVKSPTVAKTTTVKTQTGTQTQTQTSVNNNGNVKDVTPTNGNQTASAYFSLGNVPWGWVAVIVIFVLFATIMYLLFNRQKI